MSSIQLWKILKEICRSWRKRRWNNMTGIFLVLIHPLNIYHVQHIAEDKVYLYIFTVIILTSSQHKTGNCLNQFEWFSVNNFVKAHHSTHTFRVTQSDRVLSMVRRRSRVFVNGVAKYLCTKTCLMIHQPATEGDISTDWAKKDYWD